MIQIFKTIGEKLETIEMNGDGCWIHMTAPTEQELQDICRNFPDMDPSHLRAALDEEERARIEIEPGSTLILVDVPMIEPSENNKYYNTLPLGIIPIGSGNDLAFGLGFHEEAEEAVERIFNGAPRPLDLARVTDERGKTEARFVEHEQLWLGHQRAAHGQHLPLAAGERAGELRAALLQTRKGAEDLVHGLALVAVAMTIALEGAKQQVVLHAHLAEQLALLRHQRHAHRDEVLDLDVALHFAPELNFTLRGQQTHDGGKHGGLAGAVGADHRDDLARLDPEVDVVQGLHLAVGDAEIVDLENGGGHHSTPPR